MVNFRRHLISNRLAIKKALENLNQLGSDSILFVVDDEERLIGSLTDGDVRRGLLSGLGLEDRITDFIQKNPRFVRKDNYSIQDIVKFREDGLRIIPVIDGEGKVLNVINFRYLKSYLPIDAVIMAGGRGERLRPLTDKTPKPMLLVGDKPIIEHNVDRLVQFGIDDFWICVRYLGEQIKAHFRDGTHKGIQVKYVDETSPLGTIGALSLIEDLKHDTILVTNSDLLTNLDYEQFYLDFMESEADLSVATIPYEVNVPYAIMETKGNKVESFREKPTLTFYANAGIYLMKRSILKFVIPNEKFDATDLMEKLIANGHHVNSYPLVGYWLDVGKHEDFKKAQADIKHLIFN